jgi:hypothetical protein
MVAVATRARRRNEAGPGPAVAAAERSDAEAGPASPPAANPAPVTRAQAARDPDWSARTEQALRAMAMRLGSDATLDAVTCAAGSCRLQLSHSSTPAAGARIQDLVQSAMALLPDSISQPDIAPGKSVVTLSLPFEDSPRLPRDEAGSGPLHPPPRVR